MYESQTGLVVAGEVDGMLEEFGLKNIIVAATVDNAANMDVAHKKLDIRKVGCFAHTLNLGAQKVYSNNSVSKWCARIRAIIVWLKRSSMPKVVLCEKQRALGKSFKPKFHI